MLHGFLFLSISWELLFLSTFKKANKLCIIMSNHDGFCTPGQIRAWGQRVYGMQVVM